jgi:phage regulator Rha-like protein
MLEDVQLSIVEREPRVDSRLIADRLGTDHRSTFRLLTKFKTEFEHLGMMRFEIAPSASGQHQKFAFLNEDQAIFLLTLTRNTPKVVTLKLALTKAFKQARESVLSMRQLHLDREWQQARQDGKAMRQAVAEAIADFVAYAKRQGSINARRYFITITLMTCRALFVFEPGFERLMAPKIRDYLDASQLTALAAVEDALGKELRAGMAQGWPYKDIYRQTRKRAQKVAAVLGTTKVGASALVKALATSRKKSQPGRELRLALWESPQSMNRLEQGRSKTIIKIEGLEQDPSNHQKRKSPV